MPDRLSRLIADDVIPSSARAPEEVISACERDPSIASWLERERPSPDGDRPESLLAHAAGSSSQEERRVHLGPLPDETAHWLGVLFPGVVGNLAGAPYGVRALANRIRIIAELPRERDRCKRLKALDRVNESDWRPWNDAELDKPIEMSERRVALYESIIERERNFLLFDPAGDGSAIEIHGTLGPDTRNVGILVPGTGSELARFDKISDRCGEFVEETPDGSLVAIVWLDGDLPDLLHNACWAGYADQLAPRLVSFVADLRAELPPGVKITVAGHSYGGAVVGTAERIGLVADRILHVESAGMGNEVHGPGDYTRPETPRFSMTAPGDPIRAVHGVDWGRMGHGVSPDVFPGVIRLETGCYPDDHTLGDRAGRPLTGFRSHFDVFVRRSDAWWNIYNVINGGRVTLWQDPNRPAPVGTDGIVPGTHGTVPEAGTDGIERPPTMDIT